MIFYSEPQIPPQPNLRQKARHVVLSVDLGKLLNEGIKKFHSFS